jgi:hypothetical protein
MASKGESTSRRAAPDIVEATINYVAAMMTPPAPSVRRRA